MRGAAVRRQQRHAVPSTDDFVDATIVNAPANGQLYGIPNDIRYAFSDRERERTNVQSTVQFAPVEGLTLTADYTYALNELTEDRGEQTIWLQRNGFDRIEFDTGEAVATPVLLHEFTGASKDFGYEQQHREQKNDLNSIGFNASWDVSRQLQPRLRLPQLAVRAAMPDDGVTGGSETAFSLAGKVPSTCSSTARRIRPIRPRRSCAMHQLLDADVPVQQRPAGRGAHVVPDQLAAYAGTGGNTDYTFGPSSLGSQILRIDYQEQNTDIKQARIDGKFTFENGSTFGFGVETRAMESRQLLRTRNLTMGDWGVGDTGTGAGHGRAADAVQPHGRVRRLHSGRCSDRRLEGQCERCSGQWALDHGVHATGRKLPLRTVSCAYNPGFNTDSTCRGRHAGGVRAVRASSSNSAPCRRTWWLVRATSRPTCIRPTASWFRRRCSGRTTTTSRSCVRTSATKRWSRVTAATTTCCPTWTSTSGLSDSLKARFSYSKTIARAGYGNLTAGQNAGTPGGSTINGFLPNGNQNNPALLPLESDNFDISLEYYFSDTGYVSLGAFQKNVENFIGNSVEQINLFGIRNQTGGPSRSGGARAYLQRAVASPTDDSALFTATAMLRSTRARSRDANGTWTGGLANYNGTNAQHVAFATKYDILPTANDPLYTFNVSTPVNNKEAKIHGFEFGGQYFFGEVGFGVLANYTMVDGDIGYDVTSDPNVNQFALTGLSDSANAVLMFEKFGLSARLAYNWRDEFLQSSTRVVGEIRSSWKRMTRSTSASVTTSTTTSQCRSKPST